MSAQIAFEHVHLKLLSATQVQQHRQELTTLLSQRYKVLRVLAQSAKSLVCSGLCVTTGEQVVIKRYFDKTAYTADASGYLLFRSGPIAGMRYQDARHQIMVLEFLKGRLPGPADLPEVIAAYAAMHATALANIRQITGHQGFTELADPCLSSHVPFPSADLQSISVGDCKPEHLLITLTGVRILDLETHSLRRSVWFDIFSLRRFLRAGPVLTWDLEDWVAHYCACREIPVHCYDLQKIQDCLQRVQAMESGRLYREQVPQ